VPHTVELTRCWGFRATLKKIRPCELAEDDLDISTNRGLAHFGIGNNAVVEIVKRCTIEAACNDRLSPQSDAQISGGASNLRQRLLDFVQSVLASDLPSPAFVDVRGSAREMQTRPLHHCAQHGHRTA
jgi:hypothetical protein